MSGAKKRMVDRTILPMRMGVHFPKTGQTVQQKVSEAVHHKYRDHSFSQSLHLDDYKGAPIGCDEFAEKPPVFEFPADHVTIVPSDEPKHVHFEDDKNLSNLQQSPEEDKVEEEAETEEAVTDKKQRRAWGTYINEACDDPEAWQNAPIPSSLVKWPSEPQLSNICCPSPGTTCHDFLRQRDGTETMERPLRVKLPMVTEYQTTIDQPDNMIPIDKPPIAPSFAPKVNMLDPRPYRYVSRSEYWQSVRSGPWDRALPREIVKKPLDVLPDAKVPPKKQILRKYGKDSDWLQPDEELLELVKTDRLRIELTQPKSGYTGARRNYCNPCWPRARDDCRPYNDYMYKTSSHLTHRTFPPSAYTCRTSVHGRKGPVSRSVSNLFPPHPFRLYKPERFGHWDTDIPAHKIW